MIEEILLIDFLLNIGDFVRTLISLFVIVYSSSSEGEGEFLT